MSFHPDSVQLATGACVLNGKNEVDFVIDGVMPIQWQRTYLSNNNYSSILGHGWALPFTLFLVQSEQDVVFVDSQGREISFPIQKIGQSFYSKFEHITLLRVGAQQWDMITQDGVRLVFDTSDAKHDDQEFVQKESHVFSVSEKKLVLRAICDRNGNELRLKYDSTGLLASIERPDGIRLQLIYDRKSFADGARLTEVHRTLNEVPKRPSLESTELESTESIVLVSYRYDSQGNLTEVLDAKGHICQRFSYKDHLLVERHEASGLDVYYEWSKYGSNGEVISMRYSSGVNWHFTRNKSSRHVCVTQSSGVLSRTIEQYFDDDAHLIRSVDAAGGIAKWERDTYGNVLSYIDPEGYATQYEYDQLGRIMMVRLPDGSQQVTQWLGSLNQPASITDGLGRTTRFEWDEHGNLLQSSAADGSTTNYRYNERGLPVTIIDALGKSKQLHYNQFGQLVQYMDCSGQSTYFTWDLEGNVLTITDALGQVTRHGYSYINRSQRLTSLLAVDGGAERFAYNPAGQLIAHQNPLQRITRYQLDVNGNPLVRTNALGDSLQYRYDGFGRLTRLINENDAEYRFAWDAQDRLLAEQGFDGRRLDYRYNRVGHLLEMVDGLKPGAKWMAQAPLTIRTHYQRDAMGRMLERRTQKSGQASARMRLAYDAAGQLTMARNAYARVQLIYNVVGYISSEILHTQYGQHSTLMHRHDLLGNRIATTLPDGRTIQSLTYGSGHVHQINIDGEVICDFERDALHREVERTQGQLVSRYQLNPMGRLLSSQVHERLNEGSLDQVNSLQRQDPHNSTNGQAIARRYTYDAAGQLQNITDSRTGLTTYQYDAIGRLTQAMAGHATERFAFDPAHNLIEPDKHQQPLQIHRPDSSAAPAQDPEASDEQWARYVRENLFDPELNPLQQGTSEHETEPSPENWGQVTSNRLKVWQEHRYQYDTWGNCVEKKSGKHQMQHFTWDAEHQLIAAQTENQKQEQGKQAHWRYAYDPFGRRIAKWQVKTPKASNKQKPEKLTHFTWDGNRLLAEYELSFGQEKSGLEPFSKHKLYLYEPGSFVPLAQIESVRDAKDAEAKDQLTSSPFLQEVMQQARNDDQFWNSKVLPLQRKLRSKLKTRDEAKKPLRSRTYYIHADHLGTPRELTNSTGEIVWFASYKAWGTTASIEQPLTQQTVQMGNTVQVQWVQPLSEEAPVQNLRFQGQYFDAETGLHYNRFRYYDPDCGRFINQDPIRLRGSTNFYHYAPNPIQFIDPWGLEPEAYKINGKTLCIKNKFPSGSAESKELQEFGKRWQKQIDENGGSMTRRKLTPQEQRESDKWKKSVRCECGLNKVAGHVPDAAAGGSATPKDWMAQFPSTNSYVGGIVSKLPVGYSYDTIKMVSDLGGC